MSSGQAETIPNSKFNLFESLLRFFRNINRLYDETIDAPCKKRAMHNLLRVTVILVILELLAYAIQGIFSWAAVRIWLIMGLGYFLSLAYVVVRTLGKDILERRILSLAVIAFIAFVTFYGVGNLQILNINYESVLQVPTGLDDFQAPDFNYTSSGFDTPNGTLGYPSRHYLLLAIPALLGGRTVLALQLGYALIFFSGLLICYAGLRNLIVKKWNLNPLIAALAVLSFFTFPYLFEFLKTFEQAMLPISYTMHAIGWFLLIIDRMNWYRLFQLMWVGGLLATGYTPMLGSWGIMLAVLLLLWFAYALNKPKYLPDQKIAKTDALIGLSSVILYMIVFCISTFPVRATHTMELRTISDLMPILNTGLQVFFLGRPVSFIGILLPVVLVYLFLGIVGRLGIFHFVLSGWVLSMVVFALVLTGYDRPTPEFALNRALMIIPPLVIAILWVSLEWFRKHNFKIKPLYLAGVMIILLGSVLWNFTRPEYKVYKYFNFIKPVRFIIADVLQQAKLQNLDQTRNPEIVFYTDDPLKTNFADYLNYFFPKARVTVVFQNKIFPNNTEELTAINVTNGALVYADSGKSIALDQLGISGNYPVETISFSIDHSPYHIQRVVIPANIN